METAPPLRRTGGTRRRLLDLVQLPAMLTVVALSLDLALPQRVVVRSIGGSAESVWVAGVCSAVFAALAWAASRHSARARLDAWAGVLVFVAFAWFENNRLVFLAPLCLALAWFAWRTHAPTAPAAEPGGPRAQRVALAVLLLAHVWLLLHLRAADVGLSSALGAEAILRGADPYTDAAVLKNLGATYGPLAYALYVPAAAIWKVAATEVVMAALGHVAMIASGVALAHRLGRQLLPALLVLLAFPVLTYTASVSAHDDWVAAGVLLCLAAGRPFLSGLALGAAAAIKLYPVVLLPILLARWRTTREQAALLAGLALVWVLALVPVVAAGGSATGALLAAVRGQATRLGISLWNVPPHEWWPDPWALLFNFGHGFDPPAPRLQTLVKVACVLAAVVLAARVRRAPRSEAPARACYATACATLVLLLGLNNLNWNYISWWAPLTAVLLWAPPLSRTTPAGRTSTGR